MCAWPVGALRAGLLAGHARAGSLRNPLPVAEGMAPKPRRDTKGGTSSWTEEILTLLG